MVLDSDKEPKAAVAILARSLGESEAVDTVPTVGKQSSTILGNEISRYLDCHNTAKLLHVHALRPGDGFTVARALGQVHERYGRTAPEEDSGEARQDTGPGFVLELYPSEGQRGIAGRFLAEASQKRRTGAGIVATEDAWMLESLSVPGGVSLPRLRWARKSNQNPQTAAHLAVAFDTFDSRVVSEIADQQISRPLYAFGLLSFFDRQYTSNPSPLWRSLVPVSAEGEKHPSDRTHTDRLVRLQQALRSAVTRRLGPTDGATPSLRTEISPEKAHNLRQLHRLCDWVITLDRNAGIEYFDSPRENKEIYDAYVIDCVPERQDLGCLQLITSTSNLEEVRDLLDSALDQMGLSRSRRNAEFLMEHLKALSGRLAIRLTGDKAPTSELIGLALSHANCRNPQQGDECWLPIERGFFIAVDDIRDLLPPLDLPDDNSEEEPEPRPDLIYVSAVPRKGLSFRFIEIKYRRHLRTARNPDTINAVRYQVESLRKRWEHWYCGEDICAPFRAVRRAKLARVLRFYADKAYRHYLQNEHYVMITSEIDRMIDKGQDYAFVWTEQADRGWVFCPEYAGSAPMEIGPAEWGTRIFLFGPGLLPDSDFRRDSIAVPPQQSIASIEMARPEETGPSSLVVDSIVKETILESSQNLEQDSQTGDTCAEGSSWIRFGTDVLTGTEVQWRLSVKGNPHLLIAGLPGMGKTTCLLNLCGQMLAAGVRPIIFSYHQDIDEKLQHLVKSIRFIDFDGLGFNPLRILDRQTKMAYLDVAGALRDIFTAIFPELGDIQGERIRRAIKESFVEAGWDDSNAATVDLKEPNFKRFVEILRNDPKPDRGLRTLLSRLDELDDYGFFNVHDSAQSLWDSDQPIVVRIHTTQNENLQKAFASLVFYGLYKDMFRRGIQEDITHAIVFDEAHRAANLKLIPTMAKECRKYGISLVVASQEARDFNISLFSAIANYLVLRLTEADAKVLVRNVSNSQQERLLVDKIKQMERFRALYFSEGKTRPSLVSLESI